MDLHELLDAATADLPDAPDLLPRVQRIHHRRTVLTRGGMLAAAVALAVGAGTLTTAAPWHHSGAAITPAATSTSTATYEMPAAGIERYPVGHRETAPRLSGTTVAGKAYTTSYTGHVTVIQMWGSWCTPCRDEAATYAAASKQFAGSGVRFLGIDVADDDADAVKYEMESGIDYPSLADRQQSLMLLLKSVVPPDAVPATVIVDKDGEIAVAAIGPLTKTQLDAEIAYAST